jgi:membrane-anchored protein YejM (alkaline phosphatase superfamily)
MLMAVSATAVEGLLVEDKEIEQVGNLHMSTAVGQMVLQVQRSQCNSFRDLKVQWEYLDMDLKMADP